MHIFPWSVALIFFVGCSPSSLKDYHKEGESLMKKLALDLENIHTREELSKSFPELKKRFESVVDLIIEAKLYKEAHPEDLPIEEGEEGFFS